ncbi:hypothetical protein A9Q02_15785 [Candidatus Chloroploca asiatica]|uniref:Uncharacterized protein n=1 Tax=Candidatus Chloroploca asiatica TaxID=1506545 RepID=A0A2H3L569_9CHLR|nr:hypothetical protein A9Q02_15785 [Candidatus Chloroploca asiatica]
MGELRPPTECRLGNDLKGAVIIAMVAVNVVQAPVDEIVEMVAVGHERMPTADMTTCARNGGAAIGIGCTHRNHMLIVMARVGMMQMPIVQIINMPLVAYPYMAAMLAMHMRMVLVLRTTHCVISSYHA